MDLVGFENTVVTDLFIAARPEGAPYLPAAITALAERYRFAAFPTKLDEFTGEKAAFRHGLFDGAAIHAFDIFSDGVVVASKSPSDLLEAFIADVCGWMASEFGLKRVETHEIHKSYESHLIVRSPARVFAVLESLKETQEAIATSLATSTKLQASFRPAGFALAVDATTVPGMKPIAFRVERKGGVAFDMNYYYSAAPLPTAAHLKVLRQLERRKG